MIQYLIGLGVILMGYLYLKFIFQVKLKMKQIKNQDPENIIQNFRPISGLFGLQKEQLQKNGHAQYFLMENIQLKPKTRIFLFNFYDKTIIQLADPKLNKEFFLNQNKYNKFTTNQQKDIQKYGLLRLEQHEAQYIRKFMGKMFNFEKIQNNHKLIKQLTDKVFSELKEKAKNQKIPLKLVEVCSNITGQVVTETFFSINSREILLDGQTLDQKVINIFTKAVTLQRRQPLVGFKRIILGQTLSNKFLTSKEKEIFDEIEQYYEFVNKFVKERKELRKQENYQSKDMLDYFLEELENQDNSKFKITEQYIIDNFTTLVFAGIDTSSHTAALAIYQLTKNPNILEKLKKEIQPFMDRLELHEDFENLKQCPYFKCVIQETLRMFNPAPGVFPRIAIDDHYLCDILIKKGTLISSAFYASNYNPEVFIQPFEFNPDRWLNTNLIKDSFQFTPFSAGPRNCIGQHLAQIEILVIITMFFKNFDAELIPDKKLKMVQAITIGPEDDQLITISNK